MISINNLSKSYGDNHVLRKVNVQFDKGKICAIVGENGAGKTTLFQCILGLEEYKGNIESPYSVLKNHIGFLPTHPYFISKITGREYLQLFLNSRGIKGIDLDKKNVFDLPLDQYCTSYSTGMKKKLALIAILIQENDVYILDEAFNGVDIHSNLIIVEILKELKNLGKTVVISSHVFSILNDLCDEIYLLKDGHIHEGIKKENFKELEEKMKMLSIGTRIKDLELK